MNVLKPYILIVVLIIIAGAIYFISVNSIISRTDSKEFVTVAPQNSSKQNEIRKEKG